MGSKESDEQEEKQSDGTNGRRIPRWLIRGAAIGAILGRVGLGIAASFGLHALRTSSERRRKKRDTGDNQSDG